MVLVLMEGARLASQTRELWLPPLMNAPVILWWGDDFPVTLTRLQCASVLVMMLLIVVVALVLSYGRWGRQWREVSADPLAARLSGIVSRAVFVQSYALAALLASICGVLATERKSTRL